MLISEIRQKKYQIFPDAKHNNALKYIQSLSDMTRTNISTWDILEMFKKGDAIEFDKTKINQLFFAYREQVKPTLTHTIPYSTLRQLVKNRKEGIKEAIRDNERKISKLKETVRRYNNDVNHNLGRISKLERVIAKLSDNPADTIGAIRTVIKDNYWTPIPSREGHIAFESQPVVMTYVNPAQAIDLRVPMGTYKMIIDINKFMVSWASGKDNLGEERIHPHANIRAHYKYMEQGTDSIDDFHIHPGCFGNIQQPWEEAILSRDLVTLMRLAAEYIQAYNNDSPYLGLASFNIYYQNKINREVQCETQKELREETQGSEGSESDDDSWFDEEPYDENL